MFSKTGYGSKVDAGVNGKQGRFLNMIQESMENRLRFSTCYKSQWTTS